MNDLSKSSDMQSDVLIKQIHQQSGFADSTISLITHTMNSTLYMLETARAGNKYILKVTNQIEGASNQFASMQRAYSKFDSPTLKVPRPVFIIPNQGAYCMEYIDGPNVNSIVSGISRKFAEKTACVKSCGKWIHAYHHAFDHEYRLFNYDNSVDALSARLESAGEKQTPGKLEQTVIKWIFENYGKTKTDEINWGRYHGDFKTDNMILSDGKMYGIDFTTHKDSNQIMDLVQFQNNLLLSQFNSPALRYRNTAQLLEKEFVSAYYDGGDKYPAKALSWLRVLRLFELWKMYRDGNFISKSRAVFIAGKLKQLTATNF